MSDIGLHSLSFFEGPIMFPQCILFSIPRDFRYLWRW